MAGFRNSANPVSLRGHVLALLIFVSVLFAWSNLSAQAGNTAPSEDVVKAAYLSKLRHYVEWPERAGSAEGRTVIGIVGADEVAANLLQMTAVRDPLKGTLAVRRLRIGDSLEGVSILFVGDAYFARAGGMIEHAGARSVLVVTESENSLAHGSVINFRLADERIRFEISLESAEKAGLKLSSQLLALALSVTKEKRK